MNIRTRKPRIFAAKLQLKQNLGLVASSGSGFDFFRKMKSDSFRSIMGGFKAEFSGRAILPLPEKAKNAYQWEKTSRRPGCAPRREN